MKKLTLASALLLSLFIVPSINAAPKERLNDMLDRTNSTDEISSGDEVTNKGPGLGRQRYQNIVEDRLNEDEATGDEVTYTGVGAGKRRYNSGIMEESAGSDSNAAE